MLTLYHYAKCSTCRKAQKWLESRGLNWDSKDITLDPPSREELKKILRASGKKVKDLLNTSGVQYRLLNMKEKIKTLEEEELLELLAQNGRLLKRPLVKEGPRATIGFKPEEFNKIWGSSLPGAVKRKSL
jgi:arsenate reductase